MPERINILDIRDIISGDCPDLTVQKHTHSSVSLHAHSFTELVYVKEGFSLHEANGHTMLITAGDLLLIRPMEPHRYIADHDFTIFNCLFTREGPQSGTWAYLAQTGCLSLLEDAVPSVPLRAHLSLPQQSEVESHLKEIIRLLEERPFGWLLSAKCRLSILLTLCLGILREQYAPSGDKRGYMGYILDALRYMDEHYAEDISCTEVARHAGITPDYLTRQFRLVMGINPSDYLKRFRLAQSMELLKTGMSALDIALAVGFKNQCHFSREFKKQLGMTPSEYRRKQRLPHDKEDHYGS